MMMGSRKAGEGLGQLGQLLDLVAQPEKAKQVIDQLQAQIEQLQQLHSSLKAERADLDKDTALFTEFKIQTEENLDYRERDVTQRENTVAAREKVSLNLQDKLEFDLSYGKATVKRLYDEHDKAVGAAKEDLAEQEAKLNRLANEVKKAKDDLDKRTKAADVDIAKRQDKVHVDEVAVATREKALQASEEDYVVRVKALRKFIG